MKNEPGYPLPDGELGEDELVCQLVYLPDRPEYWQAFLGALHYMTTWRAWERDTDKRGKDAAANWREAFDLTIGCWRMTCLQDLQDNVAEILAIMQQGQSCCDEQDVTYGDQYTDRVEDGVGDVPQNIIDAGYATDAADWAGFDDYKCMISHVLVNQLDARLLEIAPIINSYGAVFGGVAALTAILAVVFSTAGLAIVFGIVAGVGAVSLLYESLVEGDLLVTLAAKVVTNHEELACAVYFSDGDDNALLSLNDKIDELFTVVEAVILKNLNLGPTLKALYAGRYDQQDIADILLDAGYELDDFDCACDVQLGEFSYTFDFLADDQDWLGGPVWIASGDPAGGSVYFAAGSSYMECSMQLLRNKSAAPNDSTQITINRVIFHHSRTNSTAGDIQLKMKEYSGGDWLVIERDGHDRPTWADPENIVFPTPGFVMDLFGVAARFEGTGATNYQHIDTVTFEFDAEIV